MYKLDKKHLDKNFLKKIITRFQHKINQSLFLLKIKYRYILTKNISQNEVIAIKRIIDNSELNFSYPNKSVP